MWKSNGGIDGVDGIEWFWTLKLHPVSIKKYIDG